MPKASEFPARLERLLTLLGVSMDRVANSSELLSGSAFHQMRQVLKASDIPLELLEATSSEGRKWQNILQVVEAAPMVDGEAEPDPEVEILAHLEGALDVHQGLEVRLVQHRLALMQCDLPLARSTWEDFAAIMVHHIAVEDACVMPRYIDAVPEDGWPRGAAPFIVDNEHNKIRTWVADIRQALARIEAAGFDAPERAVHCLQLLDRQKVLHGLLEHHDLRERAFVYPHLETVLTPTDKTEIVQRLLSWP